MGACRESLRDSWFMGECSHYENDPEMIVLFLTYAYCIDLVRSRRIEKQAPEDIAFCMIASNYHPDYNTIPNPDPYPRGYSLRCHTVVVRGRQEQD